MKHIRKYNENTEDIVASYTEKLNSLRQNVTDSTLDELNGANFSQNAYDLMNEVESHIDDTEDENQKEELEYLHENFNDLHAALNRIERYLGDAESARDNEIWGS